MKMKKLLILMLLATSAMAQIPTDSLVGYYPFTGNANDYSGKSNNGTVNGATLTTDRFGNPNSAYSFNGTTDYISVLNSPSIDTFPNGQSISIWLKITAYPTNGKENVFIDKRDNSNKYYQAFLSDYNNIDSAVYRFGQSAGVSSQANNIKSSMIPINNWFNLTYTTDLNTTNSYLNGVLINTFISASPIGVNTNPLLFGKGNRSVSNESAYTGLLDDIRIYNRALDSTEIKFIYYESPCLNPVTVYDTTHVTVHDTLHVSVTDTLKINVTLTGIASPNNTNTIKVYPNPAKDHITVDFGDYTSMNGYTVKISNMLGQVVFTSGISQQQTYIDLSTFTGKGTYIVNVIDGTGNIIDTKKIILN
jgi:hypothetical protein